MSSVSVLVAHRGRITVRVQPNTSLQQVLDEVCSKAGVDPNKHMLMHGRKAVDLSAVFRFSGLQPNASLDLAERPAATTAATTTVVVQIGSARHKNVFDANTSLAAVLIPLTDALFAAKREAGIEEDDGSSPLDNVAIVYLTTEIPAGQLASTTLRSLGLTGGSVLLRVSFKSGRFVAPVSHSSPTAVPTPAPTIASTSLPAAAPSTASTASPSLAVAASVAPAPAPSAAAAPPALAPTQATHEPPFSSSMVQAQAALPSTAPTHAAPTFSLLSGATLGAALGVSLDAPQPAVVDWGWDTARQRPPPQLQPPQPEVLVPGLDLTPTPQAWQPARPFRFADYESAPTTAALADAAAASSRPRPIAALQQPAPFAAAAAAAATAQPRLAAALDTPAQFPRPAGAATLASDDTHKRKAIAAADGDALDAPCDRQQVLFRREETLGERSEFEMPDEFYNVTVEDLNMQLRDLKSKVERDDPLTTQALRDKRQQEREESYTHCLIRLHLPDGLVMQARFTAREPLQALFDHVRAQLQDPRMAFTLYTTPPKRVIDPTATFARAGLCPCSNVRIGFALDDAPPSLLPQVLDTVTSVTRAEGLVETVRPATAAAAPSSASAEGRRDVNNERLMRLLKLAKKPR